MSFLSPPHHWLLYCLRYHGFVEHSRCPVMRHVEDALSHPSPTGPRASGETCSARMQREGSGLGGVAVGEKEENVEDGEEKEFHSGSMVTFYHPDPMVGFGYVVRGK